MRFVDTSFWVALGFRRDGHHDEARAIWSQLGTGGLLTSNHVVGETWTFLRRRAGHDAAIDFIDRVERSARVGIVRIDEATEAEAYAWLRRRDERIYSFVDATSFALMRRQRLIEALAFDDDFTAAGYVEARASV